MRSLVLNSHFASQVSGICVGMRSAIFNILSERIARNLRFDFMKSILEKDIEFFDSARTGDIGKSIVNSSFCRWFINLKYFLLVSRLNSDITVVQDCLSTNASLFARSAVYNVSCIVVLLVISPILTATTFGGIIPLSLFSIFYNRWMRKLQREIQSIKGKMNCVAEESFSNIKTVKSLCSEA